MLATQFPPELCCGKASYFFAGRTISFLIRIFYNISDASFSGPYMFRRISQNTYSLPHPITDIPPPWELEATLSSPRKPKNPLLALLPLPREHEAKILRPRSHKTLLLSLLPQVSLSQKCYLPFPSILTFQNFPHLLKKWMEPLVYAGSLGL